MIEEGEIKKRYAKLVQEFSTDSDTLLATVDRYSGIVGRVHDDGFDFKGRQRAMMLPSLKEYLAVLKRSNKNMQSYENFFAEAIKRFEPEEGDGTTKET